MLDQTTHAHGDQQLLDIPYKDAPNVLVHLFFFFPNVKSCIQLWGESLYNREKHRGGK